CRVSGASRAGDPHPSPSPAWGFAPGELSPVSRGPGFSCPGGQGLCTARRCETAGCARFGPPPDPEGRQHPAGGAACCGCGGPAAPGACGGGGAELVLAGQEKPQLKVNFGWAYL